MRHAIGVALAVVLAATCGAASDEVRATGLLEDTSIRLSTARVRFEPGRRAEEGRCLALGAADLAVTLRGDPVEADRIRLVREPEPVTHVVLLDTSGSIAADFDLVREAAASYLEALDPALETGAVATFGNDLVLQDAVTSDAEALAAGARATWPGGYSALHDALVHLASGLSPASGRTAVLLVTDGFDTASLHDRADVRDALRRRPDVSVFVVGVNVPSSSHPRQAASRVFLYEIAGITGGRFFEVAPYADELRDVHRRIREIVDSEATLTVVDPEVDEEPGRLRVRSRVPDCRVRVLDRREPPVDEDDETTATPTVDRIAVPPHDRFLRPWVIRRPHDVDPECTPEVTDGETDEESFLRRMWFATVDTDAIRGCALDVVQDIGESYDPWSSSWTEVNEFLTLKTRAFRIDLPAPGDLPAGPLPAFERLADAAFAVAGDDVDTAPRKRPAGLHARPFHDVDGVMSGRTWFDLRPRLALAMAGRADYRAYAASRLAAEAERDLDRLRRRYRALAPGSPGEAIEAAMRASPDGRAIVDRVASPSPADLARHLAAWLGDVPAADLFRTWEIERIDRRLRDGPQSVDAAPAFAERWHALRRVLFAPSYARVLWMTSPVRDPATGRVGFYRIVLPRAEWFLQRLKDDGDHPVWAGLPNDLLPDAPMAYEAVERAQARDPALARQLRAAGATVASVTYESRTKPRKRNPRVAFRETRVRVVLEAEDPAAGGWEIVADVSFDPVDGAAPTPRFESLRAAGPDRTITFKLNH